MYCKNCGKELEDDNTKCPNCGCKVVENPITITISTQGMIWYNITKWCLFILGLFRIIGTFIPPYDIWSMIYTFLDGLLLIYVAHELHVYRKDAPLKLQIMLWIKLLVYIIMPIITLLSYGTGFSENLAIFGVSGSWIFIVFHIVLLIVNKKYYGSRQEKFFNEEGFLIEKVINHVREAYSHENSYGGKYASSSETEQFDTKNVNIEGDVTMISTVDSIKKRKICSRCEAVIYINAQKCPNCGSTDLKEEIIDS